MRWIEGIAGYEWYWKRCGRVVEEPITEIPKFCDHEAWVSVSIYLDLGTGPRHGVTELTSAKV